jgi:hypothetical protein
MRSVWGTEKMTDATGKGSVARSCWGRVDAEVRSTRWWPVAEFALQLVTPATTMKCELTLLPRRRREGFEVPLRYSQHCSRQQASA